MEDERTNADVINALEAPFDPSEIRTREGSFGAQLKYIDWPLAVRRMNEAVGIESWDFEVSDLRVHGDTTVGYVTCKGRMTVRFPDGSVSTKEQYGGNAYGGTDGRRGMSIDDSSKAAGSDALKKCAALFGVALDLAEKPAQGGTGGGYNNQSGGYNGGGSSNYNAPAPQNNNNGGFTGGQGDDLTCEECGEPLTETRFKDGTNWAPAQLAVFGRRKHSRILCMTHYREANQAKRRAEEALQQVPF